MVKVYRLITCNTYEREMFDKASLKLGLDRALLQSTTALKDTSQQLSRKEIEELLKKGAYGAIMEESNEESKFNEEDIDTILQRRTTTITLEAGVKGSTFAKASFNSSTNREDIDIDDPNFWSKWAKKANIDTEVKPTEKELILLEPRNRKKRFEENIYKSEGGDDSEAEESDESCGGGGGGGKARNKRTDRKGDRKRRREDDEYRPDELAFNKSEYFKVEKVLAQYGWGRWKAMREASDLKESVSEADIEHISRTLLLHCIREYRGDEKVREFVWRLILPKGAQVVTKSLSKKKSATNLTSVFHEGWAALPEFNPPAFAVDSSFQRHVHRHANKLLVRMHQLHILNTEVIGSRSETIMSGTKADEIELNVECNEAFVTGWDSECDKSFLIGTHKHGVENYEAMRADESLCFVKKTLEVFPSSAELLTRFRRLLMWFQRKRNDALSALTWSKREEAEFMRVLRSYGVKDDPSTIISWTRFRQLSPLLEHKCDSELMEQLYCVLSMCTKQLGNEMSSVDLQRAMKVEPLSARKAQKLMHRMNMMRQIHDWADTLTSTDRQQLLKLCSNEAMPIGWSTEQDDDLFTVVDSNGLDNISANIAHRTAFQKIIRPEEKTLLRRVAEIYTTLQTKKWNGTASTELLEDSDEERSTPLQATARIKRGRKKGSSSNGAAAVRDLVDTEKEKMRALIHQSFLQRLEQLPLAAAAAMAQGAFMLPQLLASNAPSSSSASSSSSSNLQAEQQQQQAALLSTLFALPSSSLTATNMNPSSSSSSTSPLYGGAPLTTTTTATKTSSSSHSGDTSSLGGANSNSNNSNSNSSNNNNKNNNSGNNNGSNNSNSNNNEDDVLNLSTKREIIPSTPPSTSSSSSSSATATANISTTCCPPSSSVSQSITSTPLHIAVANSASASGSASLAAAAQAIQSTPSALINTLNFTELFALANLPPETHVPVVNVETGLRLSGDEAPKIKNLGQWLSAHPKFVLDIPSSSMADSSTMASLSCSSSLGKSNENAPKIASSSTTTTGTPLSTKAATTRKEHRASSSTTSNSHSKDTSATPSTSTLKGASLGGALEPGEIPKSVGSGLGEQPIAVFDRTTGVLLSADRWPSLRNLSSWLDKHPDCNVHSSSATVAAGVLSSKRYNDRLGGEISAAQCSTSISNTSMSATNSSSSSIEALQMQMMLQQALMNQSLLSITGYNPLNSYAMLAAAAAASSSTSSSSKVNGGSSKDMLNGVMASLMMPSSAAAAAAAQMQHMQSLLALDPSLLFAANTTLTSTSASASALNNLSSSFLSSSSASSPSSSSSTLLNNNNNNAATTTTTAISSHSSTNKANNSTSNMKKTSAAKGRLNAVVEKLSSSSNNNNNSNNQNQN